jgi:hypothetical protein
MDSEKRCKEEEEHRFVTLVTENYEIVGSKPTINSTQNLVVIILIFFNEKVSSLIIERLHFFDKNSK